MENLRNSITLQVRVPVLSENMYLTWPSSSLMLEDWLLINKFCFSSYISMSHIMNEACQNLTNSKVIKREIGTKFVKIRNHVPSVLINTSPHCVSQSEL